MLGLAVGIVLLCAAVLFVLLPILLRNRLGRLRPVNVGLHLLRGVMSIVMLGAIIFALSRATMADTYAMFMSAPLIGTEMYTHPHGICNAGVSCFRLRMAKERPRFFE